MRKFRSLAGIFLASVFLLLCLTPQAQTILCLPAYQKLVVGQSSEINIDLPRQIADKLQMRINGQSQSVFSSPAAPTVAINKNGAGYQIMALKPGKVQVSLKLWGYIPIRSMAIEALPTRRVVVGGHSIGVILQSKGIMVVGYAPVVNEKGKFYPAKEQGVDLGDLILKVDGQSVATEEDLARIIDKKKGNKLVLDIKRKDKNLTIPVVPLLCTETQRYRIGLYVRDGVVGVGTLTFWDPEIRIYGALGHIILDADTRQGINVLKGKIVSASIQTIKPGVPGKPGEKIGIFDNHGTLEGNIIKNTYSGIYGSTTSEIKNPLTNFTMEVAYAHQVKTGKAQIYTVINGEDIEAFDINIEKVYPRNENGKGMVIRVTDHRLLSLTGGIIQGMSGSPIIQDNRIVGAITHVFLNDPQRGYGIFMDNMLSEMPLNNNDLQKVSTN